MVLGIGTGCGGAENLFVSLVLDIRSESVMRLALGLNSSDTPIVCRPREFARPPPFAILAIPRYLEVQVKFIMYPCFSALG